MSAVDERAARIAGLRALADALEANPDLPLPGRRVAHCVRVDDDAAGQAEVMRAAELLGVEAIIDGGSAHASRTFGGVTYEVFHVGLQRRADHDALMSYRGAVAAPAGA
ncbi:hypothetical protein FJK98_02225 [Micromonospora sp. HM134]|uniref:hypothetical protein n=1 Tax=Micromonospora sp. HM134 TaxID=2583243 RepID=UPI0011989031|nr:hypothetical protein [Micromonospora sp. HM134]QDY06121.1 hypothetical protein FJK98_02225 [Micromonospora sp. HM134]